MGCLISRELALMPRNAPFPPIVFFPLIIDQDLSAKAQKILRSECGSDIRTITLECIPDRHEMRLWVTLTAAAYTLALHALILSLPAAEFGAVKLATADNATLIQAA